MRERKRGQSICVVKADIGARPVFPEIADSLDFFAAPVPIFGVNRHSGFPERKSTPGIGLENVRKRLSLIYGEKNYSLEIRELEDSFYLPQGDYTEVFKSLLNWVVVSFAVFGYVILFAFYLLAVMFYACCSYAVSALMKKKFEFDLRMRLSVLAFVATYAVFSLLGLFGFSSRIIFFIAVMALQGLILKDMAAEQPEAKSE